MCAFRSVPLTGGLRSVRQVRPLRLTAAAAFGRSLIFYAREHSAGGAAIDRRHSLTSCWLEYHFHGKVIRAAPTTVRSNGFSGAAGSGVATALERQ